MVLRFLPEGGYEKYARIIIGVMVLSQLALPLLSLGGFDAEAVFSEALTEYEQEMQRIETQVEQAGLKGRSVGGAQVSPKHAGFIVNTGGATCQDVLDLIALIQKTVQEKFGVALEPEVRVTGEV